jgi:hypothetical protein
MFPLRDCPVLSFAVVGLSVDLIPFYWLKLLIQLANRQACRFPKKLSDVNNNNVFQRANSMLG